MVNVKQNSALNIPQSFYTLSKIHTDETRVQVLHEKDRKNTTDSYMWVYGVYKDSKFPIRIFEYHPTRNGDHAKEFLKRYSGYLVTDVFKGCERVGRITCCYCWSHLRRYFVDALPSDLKKPEATLPTIAIEYCKKQSKQRQLFTKIIAL